MACLVLRLKCLGFVLGCWGVGEATVYDVGPGVQSLLTSALDSMTGTWIVAQMQVVLGLHCGS